MAAKPLDPRLEVPPPPQQQQQQQKQSWPTAGPVRPAAAEPAGDQIVAPRARLDPRAPELDPAGGVGAAQYGGPLRAAGTPPPPAPRAAAGSDGFVIVAVKPLERQ